MIKLPPKTPTVWRRFFAENKPLVFRYVVKQLEKAIPENAPKVDLFQFDDGYVTDIKFNNYGYMLEQCMQIFLKEEDYEYADRVKKLLDQYHINKLLKEV